MSSLMRPPVESTKRVYYSQPMSAHFVFVSQLALTGMFIRLTDRPRILPQICFIRALKSDSAACRL
jgi:hypothetical protein